MSRRQVRVEDASQADFGTASKIVRERVVGEDYRYRHRNLFWRLVAAMMYYIIAPIPAFIIVKLHGMRFVNRRAVRQAGGCYIYGNHTHWTDVFVPYMLSFPRRAYIITGPTAVSVPVAKYLVPMFGGIPLNASAKGKMSFRKRTSEVVARGHPLAIFPEAHLWPYYNGIRDFTPYSFTYPVHAPAPVIPYVVTYRRRRWLKSRRPLITVTVGEPILPEAWQSAPDPKTFLRDKVRGFMVETATAMKSYAWVEYSVEDFSDEAGPVQSDPRQSC